MLRQVVQDHLDHKWSPEQIVRRLRRDFPDRPEMQASAVVPGHTRSNPAVLLALLTLWLNK